VIVLAIPVAVALVMLVAVLFATWRASSGRCPSLKDKVRCKFHVGHKGPHCGRSGDDRMYTLYHWHDASSAVDALMVRVEREAKRVVK